jgi:hypothetical protein
LEAYLVCAFVERGFRDLNIIAAFLNASVLAGFAVAFSRMVSKAFLKSGITPDRLHRFASERCRIIADAHSSGLDEYLTRRNLITNTLKFSEECLRGWLPGSHFELCVFVDQEQPLLFAYFDSNHDTTALSTRERERNPRLYIEKGYEVTKLLRTPTSYPRVLRDTHDAKAYYVFTSDQQRKQLKSSVLLCLDVTTPCALVASSNEKNAFPETDPEVMSFIKYIGALVRYDLFEGDFVRQIRGLKPELFDAGG